MNSVRIPEGVYEGMSPEQKADMIRSLVDAAYAPMGWPACFAIVGAFFAVAWGLTILLKYGNRND